MLYSDLEKLYNLPFFELLQKARRIHEEHWTDSSVQLCTLLSIKTGGCSEDCSYCAQSARYSSGVAAERLMEKNEGLDRARAAKAHGSTRFCMGAAWRGVRTGTKRFESVLEIVREVAALNMEVCVTLGELGEAEAAAERVNDTRAEAPFDVGPDLGLRLAAHIDLELQALPPSLLVKHGDPPVRDFGSKAHPEVSE